MVRGMRAALAFVVCFAGLGYAMLVTARITSLQKSLTGRGKHIPAATVVRDGAHRKPDASDPNRRLNAPFPSSPWLPRLAFVGIIAVTAFIAWLIVWL